MQKLPRWSRHWWVGAIGMVLLFAVVLLAITSWRQANAGLPKNVVGQVEDFTVYFFAADPPEGFALDKNTAQYNAGLLSFQLRNKTGQVVTISEQALPPDFANAMPQAAEKVDAASGTGVISTQVGRTIGTLPTKDGQTLILLNADASVKIDTFKTLMRTLQATR